MQKCKKNVDNKYPMETIVCSETDSRVFASQIISQAQYWLIVSFSRRNWERKLQALGTFWREIKVVHLLRNASGKRGRCSEEVGTEEMKGESGKKEKIPAFIPFVRLGRVPGVLSLLIRLENVPIRDCTECEKLSAAVFPGWIPARFSFTAEMLLREARC